MTVPTEDLREAIRKQVFVTRRDARIVNPDETTLAEWIFDFRAMLLQSKWLDRYAELFWERYASQYPFQVCGMETAAISLIAAIVMKGLERGKPVNGLFIRKSRKRAGLLKQIEGTLEKNPVILVDDLINSGSTFNKQIKILHEEGVRVSDIFALLSFRTVDAYKSLVDEGVRLHTVFTLRDFDLAMLPDLSPVVVDNDAFTTLWHFKAPQPSYNFVVQKSAPIIDDERVYFGTDAGIFFALDKASGNVVWSFTVGKHPEGKGIFSSAALSSELVYFGAYDGNVYALDKKTGKRVWMYDDADWVGSSPALAPKLNLLFVGLEFGLFQKRGGIAAVCMDSGKRLWEDRTRALTHASPLYIEEEAMVVIGSNDSVVYAYEATTGKPRWGFRADNDVKSSFAYDPKRGLILFGGLGRVFYALFAKNGEAVFAKELGSGMYSTPIVDDERVYFSSLDKHIYALELATGKQVWSFSTNGRIFASPVIAGGSLWCGSNDGKLYEIDPQTGKLRNFFQTTERIVNKIAYDQGTGHIFLETHANEVYCLKKKRRG